MKPVRVTLFVFLTIMLLGLVSAFFPADGIRMGSFTLHFPTIAEIFSPEDVGYADITDLALAADSITGTAIEPVEKVDSGGFDVHFVGISELKTRHLEFPDGRRNILYPFFRRLDSLSVEKRQVRILHYGDSQIEGDRITHLLRRKFQSQFGGSGPGIVPVVELYNSNAVKRSLSGGWQRFTLFGPGGKVPHSRFGAMASFSRFRPVVRDTIPVDTVLHTASVTFQSSGYGFSQCRIFAGNARSPVALDILSQGELVRSDTIREDMRIIHSSTAGGAVTLTFTGYDSPDIYGVDLAGGSGVMVDNIPMRGSSGTVFTRMNSGHLQQMYNALNVELFILQFGGNVMPYIKNEQECINYGNWFYSQLLLLKKVRPSASIIVIGPSDMSYKEKEYFVTYPLLENVRDALKEAAFKAGAAYWDMYEAMGGRNSMPSWVAADPPLAATDYTHFSPRGARLIGEMFYNALIWEYQLYRKGKK